MSARTLFVEGIGPVQLVRKARSKRLRISIKASGEVLVTIPWLLNFSRGEAFLEEKMEWVLKTRKKLEKQGLTRKSLQPGWLFATRNFDYHLVPQPIQRIQAKVRPEERMVLITYPEEFLLDDPDVKAKLRLSIEGVLRYEAKRYLPGRIRELAVQFGYSFKALTIKNNRTNWGSCSSLKNINLNLHLMRLPDRLIDFIVVHELVHTKIANHGQGFKDTLKSHFPDAAVLDKEIKKFRPEFF